MHGRGKTRRAAPQGETRLAYSTGGETERPALAAPAPGPDPRRASIRLHLDRRAAGRTVTVVTGLPGSRDDRAALLSVLKSTCGTGGTLKDDALELQGDHRDAVEAALAARGLRSKRAGG